MAQLTVTFTDDAGNVTARTLVGTLNEGVVVDSITAVRVATGQPVTIASDAFEFVAGEAYVFTVNWTDPEGRDLTFASAEADAGVVSGETPAPVSPGTPFTFTWTAP